MTIYRIQYSHDRGASWLNVGQPYASLDDALRDAESGRAYALACGVSWQRVAAFTTAVVRLWDGRARGE